MKTIAIFIVAIAIASAVQIETSSDLALRQKIDDLKKTGWGRIAVNLMQLQFQTGGPIAELITAFQNLIRDLNFKVGSTQEEYRWDKAEHFELDKLINTRLRDAKVRFGVATAHLQNTLYPQRAQLEHLIAVDEQLISDSHDEIEKATDDREAAQAVFEAQSIEHQEAIGAVQECQRLVQGLLDGSLLLSKSKKAQNSLKKMTTNLRVHGPIEHLALALVDMAQDFADSTATQKVADLLSEMFNNLVQSEYDLGVANDQSIATFEAFLDVTWNTIHLAEGRVDANTAALEVCNAEIAHQEGLRDTAEEDRDAAQAELDEETARWDAYVLAYEALIAELMAELDAVSRCIDVFANADLSADMMAVVDTL